jgi:hypothetical protein
MKNTHVESRSGKICGLHAVSKKQIVSERSRWPWILDGDPRINTSPEI